MAKKPLTLRAYQLGKGTKRERKAFAQVVEQWMGRAAHDVKIITGSANSLAQATGIEIDYDEGLPELMERVRDDPKAAPLLTLISATATALDSAREVQDKQRKASVTHGAVGGAKASAGNKKPNGLTPTQTRRSARFAELKTLGIDDKRALNTIASVEKCNLSAVRQSLRAAGVAVCTRARQGTRRR